MVPGLCSYPRLYTHIRFGARRLRWERTHDVCLSMPGLSLSQYDLFWFYPHREFAVRLCLLVMSEVIFLCCLFVCLFVFQYENHFWKMLWSLSFHSSFLSVAVLIHSDQKQHRGKIALYQLPGYSPSLKRSESWNSSRTLKQWPWRNNSYWLAGRFTQLAFVCSTGPTCPRKQWTWIS